MASWKEITDAKIFKKEVMDAIIAEFVPPEDATKITDAFMPIKLVNDDRIIALRRNGAFGKTSPASLKAEHQHIPMLGGAYIESTTGIWRESVILDEQDLTKVRNPVNPKQLWGQEMMGEALNLLDIRLNNRIEQLASDVIFNNGYNVAQYGVNYSYAALVPPKYRIDLGASPASGFTNAPWIAVPNDNRRWSDTTNSLPLTDLREVRRYAGRWGMDLVELWMNSVSAGYIEDNATAQKYIQASASLSEKAMTVEKIVEVVIGLKGFKVVVDDRFHNEETYFTAASVAGDTTIVVQDSTGISLGDTLTLRNGSLQEEDVKVHASTPIDTTTPGAHIITLSAGTVYAYAIGDRVTLAIPYIPNNKVVLRAKLNQRNSPAQWISVPSLIKSGKIGNPQPGRYTWSYFRTDRPPYFAEIGAGIHGGPVVFAPGAWIVMNIAA